MLKRRVEARDSIGGRNRGQDCGGPLAPAKAEFVEVSGLARLSSAMAADETVVEVVAHDGAKLTIRLKGENANVGALIESFRGRS